jgi:hypothetical protein
MDVLPVDSAFVPPTTELLLSHYHHNVSTHKMKIGYIMSLSHPDLQAQNLGQSACKRWT